MRTVLLLVGALACTPDTPFHEVREPTDLAFADGAIYRLQDLSACGEAGIGSNSAFNGVTIENRLERTVVATTRTPDPPCGVFDGAEVLPGESVDLAFFAGGTLLVADDLGEPLHVWLTVGSGTVVVQ